MIEFDVTKVKNKIFKKLRKKYLSLPEFNYLDIKQQSQSASCIFLWIKAIDNYQRVYRKVNPIELMLKKTEKHLKTILQD